MSRQDPYRTLMVHPEADAEIIRVVYRKLAQRYHPDVADDADAARRMAELNAARDLLLDPQRRAAYDEAVAARAAPAGRAGGHDARPAWTDGAGADAGAAPPAGARPASSEPAAGPPPGNPSGSVVRFGRYAGWSLGEIARTDIEYVEWLDRMPIGRPFRAEIDALLRAAGRRGRVATAAGAGRR